MRWFNRLSGTIRRQLRGQRARAKQRFRRTVFEAIEQRAMLYSVTVETIDAVATEPTRTDIYPADTGRFKITMTDRSRLIYAHAQTA
jgi:hypothetical protein